MDRWWCGLGLAIVLTSAAHGGFPTDALVSAPDESYGEAVSAIAPVLQICDSGGEGATSCETKWTVSISGWGWPSGCGISCVDGHYACCSNPEWYRNAICSCIQDPQEPVPWTPETPGL